MTDIDTILGLAPVIPVLVIDRVEDARPIAEALVAGGLPALEVTLRTPVALAAIREMKTVTGAKSLLKRKKHPAAQRWAFV